MNNVMKFIQISKDMSDTVWVNEDLKSFFNIDDIQDTAVDTNKVMYFSEHKCSPFALYRFFGNQLSIFKKFKNSMYISLYKRVYYLDVINCICELKINYNLCNAEYYTGLTRPKLNISGFYHPSLYDKDNVVKNNIDFNSANNIILTGPNAAGKSTIIKAVLINILMAQTITVCASNTIKITPFKYINSQINIPDCKGKESLFEAEMNRSKANLDMLTNEDGFSFIAMDEIFNSTNPVEGISGAYAIAKKMSNYTKNLSIISTHYIYLTKLAKKHPEQFTTLSMSVSIDDQVTVVKYPYKLKRGVSTQYIALELLKINGFDASIINDALTIKNEILNIKSAHKK
jgi:DNA mismatch repair ATPase MutS